jgi:acyl-CoA synthetase (AMP-forming)/AMP-acid ligase II
MVATLAGADRIDSLLSRAARRHPERPALAFDGGVVGYRGLEDAADQLARRILETAGAGTKPDEADLRGARIAIIAPNLPALVVALFAAWWLDAVAVPLHARLREHEVRTILEDAEPTVVLSVPAHLGYSFVELLTQVLPGLPTVRSVLLLGPLGTVEGQLPAAGGRKTSRLDRRIAAVLYTSGTTGSPRGALVSHVRELRAACQLASVLSLTPADTTVLVVPIAHAFGLTCMLAGVAAGGRSLLVHSTFSPRPLLDAIEDGARVVHGPPMLFASLLEARPAGLGGIRGFVAGASPSPDLLERLDRGGSRILNLYGLTEAGAVSCCRPDDPPAVRHTTSGRLLPGFEARVGALASSESGAGELELRGSAVTSGYLSRDPEADECFREDGWFRTGDLATIEDGCVRIAGRSKELVNVGGFNVVPGEVEAVLLAHPDVLGAAVVGVPDEKLGETLRAFVVPRSGSELTAARLLEFGRARLAGYKLPYSVRLVDALPLLPSGKLDRRALASRDD